MRRPSLKIRITAWFALMMFVIEALVLSFLLAVNGTIVTNDPESRLVRMVEHNADRVKYKNRQFRYDHIHYYRSGVYTVLYDADGNALQGTFPAEFSPAQPLPLKSAQPAPVTVRWLVGTACEPISSGNLYCRSAVEKWLLAAQATLSAKPPSISMEPISIPSAIVEHAP